jgi:hypothetical protein
MPVRYFVGIIARSSEVEEVQQIIPSNIYFDFFLAGTRERHLE